MITYIFFALGFVLLIAGARILIKGSTSIGFRFGLSQLVIGLTIVAMGTSLPELIINVFASIKGNTGLAVGNVLGSNITNTLLIIGAAAIIYPTKVHQEIIGRDVRTNFTSLAVLALLANDFVFGRTNSISRIDGIILLIFFLYYMYESFFKQKKEEKKPDVATQETLSLTMALLLTVGGIAGLYFGGRWIVDGVEKMSKDLGISGSTIGLTLVAGATSLPELVTSVIAAIKKDADIAIGNVVGSNIFNMLLVLGVSAVIRPIDYASGMNNQLIIFLASLLLLILFIKTGKKSLTISRFEGILLLLGYFCFLYYTIYWQP
jgi:cation:H+ antiporter